MVDRGILDWLMSGSSRAKLRGLLASGAIVFLDAATSPRSVVEVDSSPADGYTCGVMNRAGTMVLVKGSTASPESESLAQEFIDATTDPVSSAMPWRIAVFRSTTSTCGKSLGSEVTVLPKNTSVTARTDPGIASATRRSRQRATMLSRRRGDRRLDRPGSRMAMATAIGSDDEDTPALAPRSRKMSSAWPLSLAVWVCERARAS